MAAPSAPRASAHIGTSAALHGGSSSGGAIAGASSDPANAMRKRLRSTELFGPEQEVEIEHGSSVYRLRQTALGKLILTK